MRRVKQSIYEVAGGWHAFLNLAHAWHARCLADPIVSHAFSHGYHPQHSERLVLPVRLIFDYLVSRSVRPRLARAYSSRRCALPQFRAAADGSQ